MKELAKRLLGSRWVKWAVVVIAIAVGAYEIDQKWHGVQQGLTQIGLVTALYALLALFGMQFATLRTWQVLLAGLGSPLRTTVAGRILFIGQLGKYIPGSVWPILAQMELGARARVPRTRSASASILTMLLSLLTGLLTAAVTLPFAQRDEQYLWVFLVVPVIVVCLHPRVLNPLLNRLFKLAKRPPLDRPLTGRVLLHALAWAFTAWLFNGLQIWLLAEKFGAPVGKTILLALGGYAFAWCAGFVFVPAPAGAGVRDPLIVASLTPAIGGGPALAVMLVSRAVNTISDLLMAGIAAASRRRRPESVIEGKEQAEIPAEAATPVTSASDSSALG
jgi:glycosyltransferase 2 family protein